MKHVESNSQVQFVHYLRIAHPKVLFFSIPNGTLIAGDPKKRAMRWSILKKEGALAGTADLFIALPNQAFSGLFMEFKTPKGRLEPTQKEFATRCVESGYSHVVARSCDDAILHFLQYMKQ